MAATDQNYRNQKTLDVIFGVTSILMLLSIFGMFTQDFLREFKVEQRVFRDVETAMAERELVDALPHAELQELIAAEKQLTAAKKSKDEEAIENAKSERDKARGEVDKYLDSFGELQTAVSKAQKNLDEKRAEHAANIHKYGVQKSKIVVAYQDVKARLDSTESLYYIAVDTKSPGDSSIARLKAQVDRLRDDLDKTKVEQEQIIASLKAAEAEVSLAERELVRVEGVLGEKRKRVDRIATLARQKQWSIFDDLRAMPVIDGFSSPYRINQFTLDNLPIDYSFKHVTRYDRCTTCHLGMERASYDPRALTELRDSRGNKRYNAELEKFREVLADRQKAKKESGGFDLDNMPSSVTGVTEDELTDARINQYAAHPRLDLFVDSNSPHPMEKFGCTICHSGQGSATDFKQATHSPNNPEEKAEWIRKFGWFSNHYWDFPMHPTRFNESGCLKCHHQVTDLIRYGNKEEAPKLLKGYNLVKEFGCFGCHEIAAMKSGRAIGPDLRLEDGIPLEEKTPAERVEASSDAANPPGTMRKVGPSLYRLDEKTNKEWLVKWLQSPRTFRDDTRMPHFYDLSTNNKAYLQTEDEKRQDKSNAQAKFPAAEIHSIAHYLTQESGAYLKNDGSDIYTRGLKLREQQLVALQGKLKEDNLTLGRGEADELERIRKELAKELPAPNLDLRDHHPSLAAGGIVDGNGVPVALPPRQTDDADQGRRLFIEKGCLACHKNDGTSINPVANVAPTVTSSATFGPNLSEVAYKLGAKVGDDSARLWVIQWVLNPMIHHPRTRMPVTHLSPKEAADVAAWLLSQGKEWAEGDGKQFMNMNVPAPERDTLDRMVRLLLRRTRSQQEVDDLLAPKDAQARERAQAWLSAPSLRADSDEAVLGGDLTEEKMKLFIGRKAIGRLGCFGCHNIPGFETSKPIGTPLNDWGKKDAERLAFEDGAAFVHKDFNIVPARITRHDLEKMQEKLIELGQKVRDRTASAEEKREEHRLREEVNQLEAASKERVSRDPGTGKPIVRPAEEHEGGLWTTRNGKEPFEEYFFESLEHHHRDGFLHLKLAEPRSYDFNRDREWDDRLRMPQFKFARPVREHNESAGAFHDRTTREEAEAREAVMTFVLGLVADPIPLAYVYSPRPDRAAEVKGRQVLEKFNCGGCHLIRPGIYDLKPSEDMLKNLAKLHKEESESQNTKDDHVFPEHNAWTGLPPSWPGRLTAFGRIIPDPGSNDIYIRLMQAIQIPKGTVTGADPNLRSFTTLPPLKPDDIVSRSEPYGGAFTELLAAMRPNPENPSEPKQPWLVAKDKARFDAGKDNARASLPPMLWRQGERTQPDWLFRFLKNPKVLRPLAILRMPKFNLSDDDARALVDYFAASDRQTNPDIGLVFPYSTVPQTQERYWREQTKQYVRTWDDDRLIKRAGELIAFYELQLQQAEAALKTAQDLEQKAEAALKGTATAAREKATAARDAAKADVEAVKNSAGKMNVPEEREKLRRRWEQSDVYAQDAYKLLANKNSICLTCHQVGSIVPKEHQGPPLGDVWERLRPEWTQRWIASPQRMIYYNTPMPMNFPKTKREYLEWFNTNAKDPHLSLEQATAVRDVLMNFPAVADTPAARKFREDQGGVK